MQKIGRRFREGMLKKRILAYRTHRLSKRSIGSTIREEVRQFNTDGNAAINTFLSEHDSVRLCSDFVRKFSGKNNNVILSLTDGFGRTLELKADDIRSIERELSNLSLQLCLFLDAGQVISKAFESVLDMNQNSAKIMYKVLDIISLECKEKNLPIENELFIYSQRLKSKLLMRFSALLVDSKSKGSFLADKLEQERKQMQNMNLSDARARAKEAETKLCFPLMLLLVSLITICSAPALMIM